jgi:hypothetical protein
MTTVADINTTGWQVLLHADPLRLVYLHQPAGRNKRAK